MNCGMVTPSAARFDPRGPSGTLVTPLSGVEEWIVGFPGKLDASIV
jgi:hypothetical protein